MVLKGPSNATDLNVLQGKAYENLADLNTFETSMSLRDRVNIKEPYSLNLFTYVHTALKWLRGAKILQCSPVEKSQ